MTSSEVMLAAPKPRKPTAEEIELIKSDVSSFASSLGFCLPPLLAGAVGRGFDDSDFRKTGPLKTPKYRANSGEKGTDSEKNTKPQPKAKPHPLQSHLFHEPDEKKNNHPKLPLMKAILLSGHWYVDAEELEGRILGAKGKKLPVMKLEELKDLVAKKKDLAERLLGQYTREYEVTRKKNGDMRLLETTARSGTSVDRISAFTCLVEDNPMANMRALDSLLSMVTSKVGKRYAFNGYEALKELFLLRLLPNRKLKCLIQQPLQNLPENKDGYSLLLFWFWEECLKQRFERFVISLEEAVKDVLPNLKDKAMKTVYALLKSKPEQERKLLSSLVNKLGDPDRKAASSAGYLLSCVLSEHPNMKAIIINEVDSFLFRPHIGLRAKYYAVNFLNQILLNKRGDGPKIAKLLVEVYFALFKVLIFESGNGNMHEKKSDEETGKSGSKDKNYKGKTNSSLRCNKKNSSQETHVELDSRLLSSLLTGVNRAFPFVSSDEADDILEVQTPILFKLAHSENFNVGVQALMLLYQITTKNQIASDRFYRALYAKLLTPAAVSSSKPEMFLGLLVKAMKNDINLRRVSAFSKRLIQVALQRPPQYACGCLFLLSEVLKAKPPLWRVMLQKESIDDELEHFEDILEEDQNIPPAKNVKLNSSVTQNRKMSDFVDDGTEDSNFDKEHNLNNGLRAKSISDIARKEAQSHHKGSLLPSGYDPRHREPVYCNADRTGLWELTILASHVHPSVAAMARTLLSGVNIVYNGDPLNDLSLGAFLDKFMEKKPRPNKKAEGIWHGGSLIAPTKKLDISHHLIGDEILQYAEDEVPPEDVVFHRFYMNKTSSSKKRKANKKASADDEDADLLFNEIEEEDENEEEEEEDEEAIDNILGAGPFPLGEEEGEFDYDDLGCVNEEDDVDLLGHGSDVEDGQTSDVAPSEEDGDIKIWGADTDEDNDDDNNNGNENPAYNGRKKMKAEKKSRLSPFANLEDFEHLMAEDRGKTVAADSDKKYKSKSEKRRKCKRYD